MASRDDMNVGRTTDFERDQSLESVLAEINSAIPDTMTPPYDTPQMPVVFIVGAPRSGTTLMSQWLAASGLFAYPSNLIARFFGNPYLGAKIQQALITSDSNRQVFTEDQTFSFSSDLGRTDGALAPSEFWYFWRRFFQFGDISFMSEKELESVDTKGFLSGLAGLEAAQGMPIVTKAMNMNWNLSFLDSIMPHVLFINVERDPFYNVQSLLYARERFFGDRDRWYSFKPPAYPELCKKPALEQVVGQIFHNREGVRAGLKTISPKRQLTIDYASFCDDPKSTMALIKGKFAAQGFDLPNTNEGPDSFKASRSVHLTAEETTETNRLIAQYDVD